MPAAGEAVSAPLASARAPEAARCAGLRRALLHDWAQGFPLQASPFQALARRLGGTLREVLGHCHALGDAGALDDIRLHWSPALQRVRWRCGLPLAARPDARLLGAIAALPGVTHGDWIEPDEGAGPDGAPRFWFDLVARSEDAARWQRERLAQVGHLGAALDEALWLPIDAPPDAIPRTGPTCRCGQGDGPCADPALAQRCEAGLPLCAHPYRSLSEAVHRSEREVLVTLRRWQRAGLLHEVGLGPPADGHATLWTMVLVGGPAPDADARAALAVRPGVAEATVLPGHRRWPWRLQVGALGQSPQSAALLRRALAACGLAARPLRLVHVDRWTVRPAPLLFAGLPDALHNAA